MKFIYVKGQQNEDKYYYKQTNKLILIFIYINT